MRRKLRRANEDRRQKRRPSGSHSPILACHSRQRTAGTPSQMSAVLDIAPRPKGGGLPSIFGLVGTPLVDRGGRCWVAQIPDLAHGKTLNRRLETSPRVWQGRQSPTHRGRWRQVLRPDKYRLLWMSAAKPISVGAGTRRVLKDARLCGKQLARRSPVNWARAAETDLVMRAPAAWRFPYSPIAEAANRLGRLAMRWVAIWSYAHHEGDDLVGK